jgi:electron transfer flavoprotein alpha/beta subunit
MKARKKEIQQIDLGNLSFEKPMGRVEIVELKPAIEERQPKEISGTPDEVAGEIVRLLKEEARVLPLDVKKSSG